jgi:predicted TIM-barrel fold metal-dependent hydrolase
LIALKFFESQEGEMPFIVDSQVHIWSGVIPGLEIDMGRHRPGPFDAPELLAEMNRAQVAGAVLVPTHWDPAENGAAIKAARENPGRFVVMGKVHSLDNISEQLASWYEQGMLGVRLATRQEPYATWVDTGAIEVFWAEAERIGLRVMAYGPGSRLQRIAEAAQRHPGLKLTIDHMSMSPPERPVDVPNEEQVEHLLLLAKLPNVSVKVSSLPVFSRESYPFRDMWDPTRRVIDAFGPERCFFGTDLSRQPCTYEQAIEMFQMVIEGLTATEQELVLGTALTQWLDWAPDKL